MPKPLEEKYQYHVVQTVYHDNIHTINNGISYGIVLDADPSVCALDISTDLMFVTELNRKFNQYNLSPVHFMDAIEDALP